MARVSAIADCLSPGTRWVRYSFGEALPLLRDCVIAGFTDPICFSLYDEDEKNDFPDCATFLNRKLNVTDTALRVVEMPYVENYYANEMADTQRPQYVICF